MSQPPPNPILSMGVELPDPARARILVVDDDERNLLAVKTVLEDVADVVLANSGEEALRHLLKEDFAVILLDVYMPGMDGYETAQMIRSREQTKRIPIVFLSAINKESEHLLRGYSMGAVDYVFKPVDPLVLQSKVAVFVDLFRMRREVERNAMLEQQLLDAALKANAEKLKVEQELRMAEQHQAVILESLPIVLYFGQPGQGIADFVSGNFRGLTGIAFEDLQADPNLWMSRIHPADRDRAMKGFRSRRDLQEGSIEYRWQCADGEWKYFLDQLVFLRDADGQPLHFAGTLLDVTERKTLEAQLTHSQKMDAIGKLTGGIAHDFNNLLAAVLGGIGLIERRLPLAEDQRKIITMTRHAAEQGAELISRLLAFARRQQLEPAAIDLPHFAGAMRGLLSHTLGGMVQLDWADSGDSWAAYADSSQLELALMNLIINARDAMPDGGTIHVSSENRSTEGMPELGLGAGDYVVLVVADEGTGIPDELLDRVLEPFFTTKEVGKGTGLGLSMVYGFAQQSGGALRIESEVKEGTRIEIWLPRAAIEAEMPRAEESAQIIPLYRESGGLRILLVDDHEAARETIASLLADVGHSVSEAADAAGLMEILKRSPADYDVLVTDYAMPVLSGAELIKQARELAPALGAIIITGYAETELAAARPDDVQVLIKPFKPEQLLAAIDNLRIQQSCPAAAE
jgi:PAS domain S-box-containing protein